MLTNTPMKIRMCFYRETTSQWTHIDLLPTEYFDLSDNNPFDIDSVPRHSQMIDYIEDSHHISQIILTIDNLGNQKRRRMEQYFWNDQKSSILRCRDYVGDSLQDCEIIYDALLSTDFSPEKNFDLCRIHLRNTEAICTYQGVITASPDGTQEEYPCIALYSTENSGKMDPFCDLLVDLVTKQRHVPGTMTSTKNDGGLYEIKHCWNDHSSYVSICGKDPQTISSENTIVYHALLPFETPDGNSVYDVCHVAMDDTKIHSVQQSICIENQEC